MTSYPAAGRHTVRVRATDEEGGTSVATKEVDVHDENLPPVLNVQAYPRSAQVGRPVVFAFGWQPTYDPDGWINSYEIDLDGDGDYERGEQTASTVFTSPGTHVIHVRATDNEGATTVAELSVDVHEGNRSPSAAMAADPTIPRAGETVRLAAAGSDDPDGFPWSDLDYQWDLNDDGEFDASGYAVSTSFASEGSHRVRLRVTDEGGATDETTKVIQVEPGSPPASEPNRAPNASFSHSPDEVQQGDTVAFHSTSSDPDGSVVTQAWDLDDDGSYDDGSGADASRQFEVAGTYKVRLRVTDDRGATDTTSRSITVQPPPNQPPLADFSFSPSSPHVGDDVVFSSSSTDPDGSIDRQDWDLDGDGWFNEAIGPTAHHRFSTVGTHTVGLRVTDDRGATSVKWVSVNVTDAPSPPGGSTNPGTSPPGGWTNPGAGSGSPPTFPTSPPSGANESPSSGYLPAGQRIGDLAGSGLRAVVTCRAACSVRLALLVDSATARRLRLPARTGKDGLVALGAAAKDLQAGVQRSIAVRLPLELRRQIKKLRKLTLTVRSSVRTGAGGLVANEGSMTVRK
jgi:PKD repeat protein